MCVCVCVCVCVYHIFFNHSSMEGNLGCFYILAAVNIEERMSFQISVFVFFKYPELLDCMVFLFFIVEASIYCFPQWLHQFTFPPTAYKVSVFSISSPAFVIF